MRRTEAERECLIHGGRGGCSNVLVLMGVDEGGGLFRSGFGVR